MANYHFDELGSKNFEKMCARIIGDDRTDGNDKVRFQTYPPGPDGGVDGFWEANEGAWILQCKHYQKTGTSGLIHELKKEKQKVDKLKPEKYFVAVSCEISLAVKKQIQDIFGKRYIQKLEDIYGLDDLIALLDKNPGIVRDFPALWQSTSHVMEQIFQKIINRDIVERSLLFENDILKNSPELVETENFSHALEQLKSSHVVIIKGEPGIGKTTLAQQLCAHYLKLEPSKDEKKFSCFKIEDQKEAEAVWNDKEKQIFYFDDFLGAACLDASKGDRATLIVKFIEKVRSSTNKFFVLTSRTFIFNQGTGHSQKLATLSSHQGFEFELTSLTKMDKAKILRNHIKHKNLPEEHLDKILENKIYLKIIQHQNFSPRIIDHILSKDHRPESSDEYLEYINEALTKPALIWEHPFNNHIDDYARAIIRLIFLSEKAIDETELRAAYEKYIKGVNSMEGTTNEFQTNVRKLAGAYLNRKVDLSNASLAKLELFNPSLRDFMFSQCGTGITWITQGITSLNTDTARVAIQNYQKNKSLTPDSVLDLCKILLQRIVDDDFEKARASDVAWLCYQLKEITRNQRPKLWDSSIVPAVQFVLKNTSEATGYSFKAINWAMEQGLVKTKDALEFTRSCLHEELEWDDWDAAYSLLEKLEACEEFKAEAAAQIARFNELNLSAIYESGDVDCRKIVKKHIDTDNLADDADPYDVWSNDIEYSVMSDLEEAFKEVLESYGAIRYECQLKDFLDRKYSNSGELKDYFADALSDALNPHPFTIHNAPKTYHLSHPNNDVNDAQIASLFSDLKTKK